MHDISPVLAGTYDDPNYAAWQNSIDARKDANATSAASGATAADSATATASTEAAPATDTTAAAKDPQYARNGRLDRTGADAGEQNFTFSDFLDMINPLEHIPVVSSVYREVTGESINPVSRVAGDMLYAAPLGIASAVTSVFGAVGDSVIESQTGHDGIGTMIAGLFGDDAKKAGDSNPNVMLASAQPTPAQAATAQAAGVASGAPIQLASNTITAPPAAGVTTASAAAPTAVAANTAGMHFMALNPNAYAPARKGGSTQEQNIAMALAEGSHGMRIGNSIYPKMTPSPVASGTAVASATPQTPAQHLAALSQSSSSQSAYANSPQLAQLLGQMGGKSINPALSSAPTAASVDNTLAMQGSSQSTVAQLAAQASASASATPAKTAYTSPITPTIPDNLSDDPLVLKALGMYRKVGSNASTGSQVNVAN